MAILGIVRLNTMYPINWNVSESTVSFMVLDYRQPQTRLELLLASDCVDEEKVLKSGNCVNH